MLCGGSNLLSLDLWSTDSVFNLHTDLLSLKDVAQGDQPLDHCGLDDCDTTQEEYQGTVGFTSDVLFLVSCMVNPAQRTSPLLQPSVGG